MQRRNPLVLARIRGLPSDSRLFMPVVAQAELLAGVEVWPDGKRKRELRALYEQVLQSGVPIIPIDSAVAERYAVVFAQLRHDGRPIETHDIWIGAIALVHGLTVVSGDSHLRHIQGLRVEDWTIPG